LATECWREERADFDGVLEQVAGERRLLVVTVFRKRLLESGEVNV